MINLHNSFSKFCKQLLFVWQQGLFAVRVDKVINTHNLVNNEFLYQEEHGILSLSHHRLTGNFYPKLFNFRL